jgi:hypothetical protein
MRFSTAASIACASILAVATSCGAFAQTRSPTHGPRTNVSNVSSGVRPSSSVSVVASGFASGLVVESARSQNSPVRHRAFQTILGLPITQP